MNPAEKARAQLHELQKQPENRVCMDCGSRDPRWASLSLGIFICIKCAGAHRNLGAHISTPKSLDQDNWTLEQVEHMRKHGNANAKKYYEATMKPSDTWENSTKKVVSETIALENYVRKKYEYLEFAPKKPQFSSGIKQRSSTASAPASSGSILPSYESAKKSSKDDSSLINSFDKSSDLLGDEFKPREPITKSDIMMMYNNPQLQPTVKSLPTAAPAPFPAPAMPKPSYPAPNYNISLSNNYPTQYPGYNPNMMNMNMNMNMNNMNMNNMNMNNMNTNNNMNMNNNMNNINMNNMNMNNNMMSPNPFGPPLSASFTLSPPLYSPPYSPPYSPISSPPPLSPPIAPTFSNSGNIYSPNNSFGNNNNNKYGTPVPNNNYQSGNLDINYAATQFNFR